MYYNKRPVRHEKQNYNFNDGDRVVRLSDGVKGVFVWEWSSMNGHNDRDGAWIFKMDDGEKIYLNTSYHLKFPWRIPNRFAPGEDSFAKKKKARQDELYCELRDISDKRIQLFDQISDLDDQMIAVGNEIKEIRKYLYSIR
mgnify:CR=1 FL=1|tara:strand:- start:2167 stop:2589 length:423 start_codon:yes stop_codon:yes gene_type:complete